MLKMVIVYSPSCFWIFFVCFGLHSEDWAGPRFQALLIQEKTKMPKRSKSIINLFHTTFSVSKQSYHMKYNAQVMDHFYGAFASFL